MGEKNPSLPSKSRLSYFAALTVSPSVLFAARFGQEPSLQPFSPLVVCFGAIDATVVVAAETGRVITVGVATVPAFLLQDLQPALLIGRDAVCFLFFLLTGFAFFANRDLCSAAARTATRADRRRPCLRWVVFAVDFLQLPHPANAEPETNTNAVNKILNNLFMRIDLYLNGY